MALTEPAKNVEPPAPGWITLPARIIALVIVIPFRLGYDALRLVGRGIGRSPRGLMRVLRAVGRWVHDTLLHPVAVLALAVWSVVWSGVRWCGSGLAAVFDFLVVQPLRWLAVVIVWGALRLMGRGTGRLARWFHRTFLSPVGHAFLAVARTIGRGVAFVAGGVWAVMRVLGASVAYAAGAVWAAIRLTGSGIAWLFDRVVMVPLRLLAAGALWVLSMMGRAGSVALRYLIVLPAIVVWRYAGRPVWTVVTSTVLGVIAALGWAWHAAGRLLLLLFRLLILAPANVVWLYAIRPVVQGFTWAWRKLALVVRWLWAHLVTSRYQAIRDGVVRPALHSMKRAWQITVREPLHQARLTVQATMTATRQQLRVQFRRIK